jgi:hypothetical protein
VRVCYGGICTVGVVVRAGKGGQAAQVYERRPRQHPHWPTKHQAGAMGGVTALSPICATPAIRPFAGKRGPRPLLR